jgi:hypothetical protein
MIVQCGQESGRANPVRPTYVSHRSSNKKGITTMGVILLVLLLVLLFFGLGFALHALWIAAVILFIAWLVGFVVARGSTGRARWYRW